MSYKTYLKDDVYNNELTVSRLFFISPKGVDVIVEAYMFLQRLLRCH